MTVTGWLDADGGSVAVGCRLVVCPSPHYVTCACGVRWWLLCGETREEFARRASLFPRCCDRMIRTFGHSDAPPA